MSSPSPVHTGIPGTITYVVDGAFPPALIAYLNELAASAAAETHVGGVTEVAADSRLETVRRSEVSWLKPAPENQPVMAAIVDLAKQANGQLYRYQLEKFELPQLATYRAENEGFYGWHMDIGPGELANRKLSLIVALTDPAEYEGGELQAFCDNEPATIPMPLGRVVAFPSFMLHRVTPVTRGVRRSLTVWVRGNPFS
jgi:PKHD-type hydroxylase